jgi:hypothetical protein
MAITDAFRNAVSTGDVRGIRIMMKDSLLVDPTFIEFNEMNNLARSIRGLYETHDGRDIINNTSAWNDDYMNKMMVQVVGNFSHERVDHLKEVVRRLRPTGDSPKQSANERSESKKTPLYNSSQFKDNNYHRYRNKNDSYGNYFDNRGVKIVAGAAGGGIAGGVISGIAGGSVIIGTVVGAVVVGAVVAVATNGE